MNKLIIFSLIFIFIMSCSLPDELGLPSWITDLNIIFFNDIYNIEELAEEDSSLYVIDQELIFRDSFETSQLLGDLQLAELEPRYYDISCSQLIPDSLQSLIPDSTFFILPTFNMESVEKDLDPFDQYEEVTFESGTIFLTITNNTPLGIGDLENSNPLYAIVLDTNNEQELLTIEYENVPANGGEETASVDLSGLTFPNDLSVIVGGGSTGSNGELVFIDDDFYNSSIDIEVELQDIYVSAVINASIPLQEIEPISDNYLFELEYPEIFGDYSFTGFGEIEFLIHSLIPGQLAIDLTAINSEDSLMVYLQPMNGGTEHSIFLDIDLGTTQFTINSNQYNLNEFLSILPDEISYTIYPEVGDSTQVYTVEANDEIVTNIIFSSNIQFQTQEDGIWIIPKEDGEIKIFSENMEDFQEEEYEAFQSGKATFQYLNATGIEMGAQILVSDNKLDVKQQIYNFSDYDSTKVELFEIINIETTPDSSYKQTSLSIVQEDLDFFLADSIFVGARLHFYSNGEQPLSNYLSLIGELQLKILISDDLIDEEDD